MNIDVSKMSTPGILGFAVTRAIRMSDLTDTNLVLLAQLCQVLVQFEGHESPKDGSDESVAMMKIYGDLHDGFLHAKTLPLEARSAYMGRICDQVMAHALVPLKSTLEADFDALSPGASREIFDELEKRSRKASKDNS